MADVLRSALLAGHGITAIFSLRSGGLSPAPFDSLNLGRELGDNDHNIDANLENLIATTGLSSPPHQSRQKHGSKAIWCTGLADKQHAEADILLTDQAGTALAVRTADCLPILLADPKNGIAAAVHAGWRGTALQLAITAIRQMQSRGAKAKNIIASLGPCIGPCCFTIDAVTANKLSTSVTGAEQYINRDRGITANLREINALQLMSCGLTANHIEHINACTACDNKHFFSYRRDGKQTGRHLAVVALPSTT